MKERPIIFNGEMVRAILDGSKTQTRRIVKNQRAGDCWSVRSTDNPRSDSHTYDWWLPTGTQPYAALPACPFGAVGDRLWVRETWSDVNSEGCPAVAYRADSDTRLLAEIETFRDEDGVLNTADPRLDKYWFAAWSGDLFSGTEGSWRPSIHMPRWASRITLEITGVRVERLNDISYEDAGREGIHNEVWDQTVVARNYAAEDEFFQFWSESMPHYVEMNELFRASFHSLWQSIYGEESWQANPWVWVIEFQRIEGGAA